MSNKKPKRCPLALLAGAAQGKTRRKCLLRIAICPEVTGLILSERVVQEKWLTCQPEEIVKVDFYKDVNFFDRQLAPKNPFLLASQLEKLDEYGIIREGEVVKEKDVLVSIVRRWSPGVRKNPDADDSVYAKCNHHGMRVKQVYYREALPSSPKNVRKSISILLGEEHPVQRGDVLIWNRRVLGQVQEVKITSTMPLDAHGEPVDLVIPAERASQIKLDPSSTTIHVSKLASCVHGALQSCAIPARSLIKYQPMQGKYGKAQSVTPEQAHWLYSQNLLSTLFELTTLKSDDLSNLETRNRLPSDNHIQREESIPTQGKPASLELVKAHLMALGLHIESRSVDSVPALTQLPAHDQEQIAQSSGQVLKSDTINYRTLKPEPHGVFCEAIFGPETQRSNQLGHIQLTSPIVPMIFRMGKNSILQQLLGMPKKQLEDIIHWKKKVIEQGGVLDFIPSSSSPPAGYNDHGTGATAIAYLLSHHLKGPAPANWQTRIAALVQSVVVVVPAEQRPLVLLDSGNFATSDLNDHYREVINRNNRLAKLKQLNAPQVILDNECRMLQESVDRLHANNWVTKKRQSKQEGSKRALNDVLNCVLDYLHLETKSADWSARGRMMIVPTLARDTALIPRSVYQKLQLQEDKPVLVTTRCRSGAFIAAYPQPHDDPFIAISPDAASRLNLKPRSLNKLFLHRPLGSAACQEALHLLKKVEPRRVDPTVPGDIFTETDSDLRLHNLLRQIGSGEEVVLSSTHALLVGSCVTQ